MSISAIGVAANFTHKRTLQPQADGGLQRQPDSGCNAQVDSTLHVDELPVSNVLFARVNKHLHDIIVSLCRDVTHLVNVRFST